MQTEHKVNVEGMSCGHCVVKVERALDIEGISSVDVSLKNGKLVFAYDDAKPNLKAVAKEAVEKLGYRVTE